MSDIYDDIGVRKIINARGASTNLGGVLLNDKVMQAINTANQSNVDMDELLHKSGQAIARLIGAEAAFVTSGCFAGLIQGAASIMSGTNQKFIRQIPDTTGMKNEFLIQKQMRYLYDHCIQIAGGKLIEVGSDEGATVEELSKAIGQQTAGILHPVHMENVAGTIPLDQIVALSKDNGIAVLVDAAFQYYPSSHFESIIQSGADLIGFSAKYMGGANSAGFVCGKKERIEALALHSFVENEWVGIPPRTTGVQTFGRGYKLDRHDIVGMVATVKEWLKTDQEERLAIMEAKVTTIKQSLNNIPNITLEEKPAVAGNPPWVELWINIDEQALGRTARDIEYALIQGDPPIWVTARYLLHYSGMDSSTENFGTIIIRPITIKSGEEHVVAERLRDLLQS